MPKILKTEFDRWGHFKYRQIDRVGDVAIYEQTRLDNGDLMGYEVIIIQYRNEKTLPNGFVVEEGEYYPTSAQWGVSGWTVKTEELAREKMETLLNT